MWRLRMLATMPITRLNTGPSTLPDSQYSEGVSLWAPLEKIVAGRGWGGGVGLMQSQCSTWRLAASKLCGLLYTSPGPSGQTMMAACGGSTQECDPTLAQAIAGSQSHFKKRCLLPPSTSACERFIRGGVGMAS